MQSTFLIVLYYKHVKKMERSGNSVNKRSVCITEHYVKISFDNCIFHLCYSIHFSFVKLQISNILKNEICQKLSKNIEKGYEKIDRYLAASRRKEGR